MSWITGSVADTETGHKPGPAFAAGLGVSGLQFQAMGVWDYAAIYTVPVLSHTRLCVSLDLFGESTRD